MSGDTTISFDSDTSRAEAKLKRLRAQAQQVGREFSQAGAMAGRLGGPAGGIASRFLGGGTIGMGVAAGGMALSGFLAADARRVQIATEREAYAARFRAARAEDIKAREGVAAGGLSGAGSIRRMLGRGGSIYGAQAIQARGFSTSDAIAGETALAGMDFAKRQGLVGMAEQVAKAEGVDFSKALETLMGQQGAPDAVRAIMQLRGMTDTGENRLTAFAQLQRVQSREQGNITSAVIAGGNLDMMAAGDLLSGATASAVRTSNSRALNPSGGTIKGIRDEIAKTRASLIAAAEAQGNLAGLIADMGALVGMGEGSESSKLTRFDRGAQLVGQ